jgi:ABC-type dipeptide/oligopeptide/nickel transport system permease component
MGDWVLPTLSVGLPMSAAYVLVLRTNMLSVLSSDGRSFLWRSSDQCRNLIADLAAARLDPRIRLEQ